MPYLPGFFFSFDDLSGVSCHTSFCPSDSQLCLQSSLSSERYPTSFQLLNSLTLAYHPFISGLAVVCSIISTRSIPSHYSLFSLYITSGFLSTIHIHKQHSNLTTYPLSNHQIYFSHFLQWFFPPIFYNFSTSRRFTPLS